MNDASPGGLDPEQAIARIPRSYLPPWLAAALDVLSRNLALFPPPEDQDRDIIEHLYPH